MNYFENKVVWVTGASSGIGEAAARLLSERKAKVILSARRKEELERVRSVCAYPEKVQILPIDLEQGSEAGKWVTTAQSFFGPVDILISNGGVGQWGNALDTAENVERKIFEINFFGNIALTKALIPEMEKRSTGKIVAISSLAGQFGQARLSAYSAAKGALLLYYESLKEELRFSPLELQVVSPGFINTNVMFNSLKENGEKLASNGDAQANGMPPDVFAKKLLKTITGNKFHTYIGNKELLAVPLHFFMPRLFYRLIRK